MKSALILLHGAIGAASQLNPLKDVLSDTFEVYSFNFEGHGGSPSEHPFSIELFTENLHTFIQEHKIHFPLILGYSMGGYVAINYAKQYPVQKIMTFGTKFNWSPEVAQQEVKMLNPEIIEEKVPKFAQFQSQLHAPSDWKELMQKTASMMLLLGESPVHTPERMSTITTPILCTVGTADKMVSIDETQWAVEALPNAQLHLFSEFDHPIEKVNLEKFVPIAVRFFLA